MDFIDAMKCVKEGGKVTRSCWEDRQTFVTLFANQLMLRKRETNKYHQWVVSDTDMYAMDWESIADA